MDTKQLYENVATPQVVAGLLGAAALCYANGRILPAYVRTEVELTKLPKIFKDNDTQVGDRSLDHALLMKKLLLKKKSRLCAASHVAGASGGLLLCSSLGPKNTCYAAAVTGLGYIGYSLFEANKNWGHNSKQMDDIDYCRFYHAATVGFPATLASACFLFSPTMQKSPWLTLGGVASGCASLYIAGPQPDSVKGILSVYGLLFTSLLCFSAVFATPPTS